MKLSEVSPGVYVDKVDKVAHLLIAYLLWRKFGWEVAAVGFYVIASLDQIVWLLSGMIKIKARGGT